MAAWSATAEGREVVASRANGEVERHPFSGAPAAARRAAFVSEALTWHLTPFGDCGDVKGPGGCVDCAMLLVRCAVDAGGLPPFDPRPYAPRLMLHRSEEKFIGWLEQLGAARVDSPRVGDVIVWQFGRTFSHGAILINSGEVIHAYAAAGKVRVTPVDTPLLTTIPAGAFTAPRPALYFDLWGG
jgi:cell wall-associated NlpC family hydrolase